ncbi:MAG: Hpt domain-containing protein [Thermoleophilaceae bacterium]|nr:Hpt domain-containing protein [Thermoleophilaceae bacterium]
MNDTIDQIKKKFVAESHDTVARIEGWLGKDDDVVSEPTPEAASSGDQTEVAGRVREEAHRMKGAAAVLGLDDVKHRAEALELHAEELSMSDEWPEGAGDRLLKLAIDVGKCLPSAL